MLSFTFKELIFQGNAALTSAELASLWPHKSGDQVTIEAVFALANAVTKRYADAGYALCFGVVPEQDIKDGKVRVVVVEGFFKFAPLAQRTVLHARHPRSGRRLGSLGNIFSRLFRLFLGLLAILYQRVEQLRAVLVDLRIDTQPSQPDLAGVFLDPADPGAAFFIGILLASHPALLMVCARRAQADRAAVQA